jgi:hypothetical protein
MENEPKGDAHTASYHLPVGDLVKPWPSALLGSTATGHLSLPVHSAADGITSHCSSIVILDDPSTGFHGST